MATEGKENAPPAQKGGSEQLPVDWPAAENAAQAGKCEKASYKMLTCI